METKGIFHFKIIIHVLDLHVCYGHYNFFNLFSAGTIFRRQTLSSKDGSAMKVLFQVSQTSYMYYIVTQSDYTYISIVRGIVL